MSSHRILITGASGYLGGTLLARWENANLPPYEKLFALVRNDSQSEAVSHLAEPLIVDVKDEGAILRAIVDNRITIVYFLIDARYSTAQVYFIKALAEVKKITGSDVHFLHTSGAKVFSSHAGAPTDQLLLDTDPDLYTIQKAQIPKAPFPVMAVTVQTNCTVVEEAEKHGVRSYIFVPCIVYGRGEGFGNKTSIQTVAIVKAAKAIRRMYKVDTGSPTWPVCHVVDNSSFYLEILRKILNSEDPGHGKNGYFLASPGSVPWTDIYTAMATALAKRNVIDDTVVTPATTQVLESLGKVFECPPEFVTVQLGGRCTFTAEHGKNIGWKPEFSPEHIVEYADEEVETILQYLKE